MNRPREMLTAMSASISGTMYQNTRLRVAIFTPNLSDLERLRDILCRKSGIEVVAACAAVDEAVLAIRTHRPGVTFVSLDHPQDTAALIAQSTAQALPTRFLLLCSDALLQIIRGLKPIIPRSNFSDLLPEQLRELAKGSSSASPVRPNSEEPTAKRLLPLQEGLTRREAEIVDLLMQGLANKEIARRLDLAEGTVKVHVHNIFQKLAAANRLALLATAGRNSDKGRSEQSR